MQINDVPAVILCGGMGTRLRKVCLDRPKPLVEVDGKPFLEILLDYLYDQGVRRVVLCIGYKAEMIADFANDYMSRVDMQIACSWEDEPLGTGGAVKNAQKEIQGEHFFVLNGDSLCRMNMNDFLEFHLDKKALATQAVAKSHGGKDVGDVILDGERRIIQFSEKPKEGERTEQNLPIDHYMNTGVCCFSQSVFKNFPKDEKFSMEYDVYPNLVHEGFYGYVIDIPFWDIGTPERLQSFEALKKRD